MTSGADNNWIWQEAREASMRNLDNIYLRSAVNGLEWSAWKRLATAEPPQEFDLPLNGIVIPTANWGSRYSKTQDGFVHVTIHVNKTDFSDFAQEESVAVLPEGFRPKTITSSTGIIHNNVTDSTAAIIHVHANGTIQVRHFGTVHGPYAISKINFYCATES